MKTKQNDAIIKKIEQLQSKLLILTPQKIKSHYSKSHVDTDTLERAIAYNTDELRLIRDRAESGEITKDDFEELNKYHEFYQYVK